MSPIQRLVSPKLPTTLENHTHIDLPGYDVRLFYVCVLSTIVLLLMPALGQHRSCPSGTPDVSKFEEALSSVLQLYPHAARQLQCINGCWSVGHSAGTS